MTWSCDCARVTLRFCGLILALYRSGRAEISVDEPHYGWIREHGALHVADTRAQDAFPRLGSVGGFRTFWLFPFFNNRISLVAAARRKDVRPFTPAQIKLLESFADQAVIAIENVRLFQELNEALEQQTATSHISASSLAHPLTFSQSWIRLRKTRALVCSADDAAIVAFNIIGCHCRSSWPIRIEDRVCETHRPQLGLVGRLSIGRRFTSEDLDAVSQLSFLNPPLTEPVLELSSLRHYTRRSTYRRYLYSSYCSRSVLGETDFTAKNLCRPGRDRHRERSAVQRTRAQRVIARGSGASDGDGRGARIISRSPTDVQPVLDAIVESAARVCGIDDVALRLHEGNAMIPRAHFGPIPIGRVEISIDEPHFAGCASMARCTFPTSAAQNDFPWLGSTCIWRTFLSVPLCQQGELIGMLGARRTEVCPFTPAQIKLLETFADQAVIAIENVRLFQGTRERNAELREALEHQTATAEMLGFISRSPTDLQPVLDALVASAARVCGVDDVILRLREGTLPCPASSFWPHTHRRHGAIDPYEPQFRLDARTWHASRSR